MIAYWGYPVEEHQVTTDDGYILTMHRIPHGRDSNETNVGRPPVFFGPCLTCTSGVFSFGPPDNSLAYMIADAGETCMGSGVLNVVGMIGDPKVGRGEK